MKTLLPADTAETWQKKLSKAKRLLLGKRVKFRYIHNNVGTAYSPHYGNIVSICKCKRLRRGYNRHNCYGIMDKCLGLQGNVVVLHPYSEVKKHVCIGENTHHKVFRKAESLIRGYEEKLQERRNKKWATKTS